MSKKVDEKQDVQLSKLGPKQVLQLELQDLQVQSTVSSSFKKKNIY